MTKAVARPGRASPPRGFVRKPVMQELEGRLLLSADLNPAAQDTLFATPALQGAEFRALVEPGSLPAIASMQVAPILRTHELVFVDTATPEYQSLVEDMRASARDGGRNLEVVLIEAERDGVRKITDTLAQKSGLDAIHIISHARDGAVQLGSTQLDFETLTRRAASIKKWGDALAESGDLLFYGCDLAATQDGKSLVDALARLTGADVAASEDLTGNAARGGDWTLEFVSGRVEAQVAVSAAGEAQWDGILAAEQLDWDAVSWPATTLGNSYAVGSGNVAIAISGDTGRFLAGYPVDNSSFNTGGLSPAQDSLHLYVDFTANTQQIVLTIDFTHPGGVSNVSFTLFDIDNGSGTPRSFIDQVAAFATIGGVGGNDPTSLTLVGGGTTSLVDTDGDTTNDAARGNGTTTNAGSASNAGNATFTFGQSGITRITLVYNNYLGSPGVSANPAGQAVSLHDISFTANRAPVLANGSTLNYAENGAAAAINTALTVTDVDSTTLASATVSITGNFASGQDVLGFVNGAGMGNIAGSYDGATGVLTLTSAGATATLAEWRTALRAVTYANSSDAPSTAARTVSFVANDGLIDSNTLTSTVNVTAVNDAPVLADTVLTLPAVNEDAPAPVGAVGTLVSTLVGGQSDPDGVGALQGIAITATDTNGTWYYSTNNGAAWNTFTGSVASSRLLAADANTRIYFRPNANFNGTIASAITFRAWDRTSGANGGTANTATSGGTTAFSTATDTASIVVSPVNDAPVGTDRIIRMPNGVLYTYTAADFGFTDPNDTPANAFAGVMVATVPGGAADLRLNGALVTAGTTISISDINAGLFQYQADNGNRTWTFRVVDDGGTANGGIDTDVTARTMTMRTNQGANDAPVLADTALAIAVSEDAPAPSGAVGSLVAAFTGGITDADSATAPTGIAVVGSDETNGTWYYSTNGGTSWTAVGTVSAAQSLLLADNAFTRLYFQPNANFNGTVASGLTIRAWDQTSGINGTKVSTATTGGTSAFSGATDTIAATVTAVNDAPTRTAASVALASVLEDASNPPGATVSALFAGAYSDATDQVTGGSSANALVGVAIEANAATAAEGAWQWFNGVSWTNVSTGVSTGSALVLAAGTQVRFLPAADFNGTPGALTVRLIDDSAGAVTSGSTADVTGSGGTTQYSNAANAVLLTTAVAAVNDAPTRTAGTVSNLTVPEDAATTPLGLGALAYSPGPSNETAQTLTYTITTVPAAALGDVVLADGTTVVTAGATYTLAQLQGMQFRPALNAYGGPATFSWTVTDNGGTANGGLDILSESLTITVTNVNDPPVANNDAATVAEDSGANAIDVLANDSILPDAGETLTITAVTNGTNGTVAITGGGTGLTYTPNANFFGADSFTYTIADGNGGTATATVNVTVTNVNDPPIPLDNSFVISSGGSLVLASTNLSATDVDDPPLALAFSVSNVVNGRFELVAAPGVAIGTFTQAQIVAGQVRFVHTGGGAPSFDLAVSDGSAITGPYAGNIVFNGGTTPPPSSGGGGDVGAAVAELFGTAAPLPAAPPPGAVNGAVAFVSVPVAPLVLPAPLIGLADRFSVEFTRTPAIAASASSEAGGAPGFAEAAPAAQALQGPIDATIRADRGLPPIHAEGDVIETHVTDPTLVVARLRADELGVKAAEYAYACVPETVDPFAAAPLRAVPPGQPLEPDADDRWRLGVTTGALTITGLVVAAGGLWWAARASGLVSGLLATAPAWRHLDPMPAIGTDRKKRDAE